MTRLATLNARTFLVLFALVAAHGSAGAETMVLEAPKGAVPSTLIEPPALAEDVAAGKLPPVEKRIPIEPLVVRASEARSIGTYGGDWNMLVRNAKDLKLLVVYGYARLVCFDEKFELVPDLLDRIEVKDGRTFTLRLRKGHKWSDGKPFTSEDFRYYWEDIANNPNLSPVGPPRVLMVDGEPPQFEILDESTVRYSWSRPNPRFLPALAGAAPLFIFRHTI
jgi:peptide/nickel transport system substrate-binding protein